MDRQVAPGRMLAGMISILLVAGCGSSAAVSGAPSVGSPAAVTSPSVSIPAAYQHPEILADVDWVAEHLADPTVRVVDARMPLEAPLYATGHIPGAVYADVLKDVCCPSEIMDAGAFATAMGRLGIGDDTTVLVYDTDGGLWAARLWWALRYYGHDAVKVLDGGLRQWVAAGKPLETPTPKIEPAVFTPRVQAQWRAMIDEVRKAIDDPAVALVDSLPLPSYTGDLVDYTRPGHIPTSISLPYGDVIDGVSMTTLPADVLARMLTRLRLDPGQRVITYCGGGYAGARVAFVLYLMGFDRVGLYDGSLGQWTRDPANPMATVP